MSHLQCHKRIAQARFDAEGTPWRDRYAAADEPAPEVQPSADYSCIAKL